MKSNKTGNNLRIRRIEAAQIIVLNPIPKYFPNRLSASSSTYGSS